MFEQKDDHQGVNKEICWLERIWDTTLIWVIDRYQNAYAVVLQKRVLDTWMKVKG